MLSLAPHQATVLHAQSCTTPGYKMFISVQVMASLGRPIVLWSILEINEDCLTFTSLFEAIKAGRFEVISMTEELQKSKLTKTFVGTKVDRLMATSSNQTLRVCSQFGNYVRFSVDLLQENPVDAPITLPNAFFLSWLLPKDAFNWATMACYSQKKSRMVEIVCIMI